jgi:Protein of unknown function (DUF3298)/Mannan-binding protein
MLIRKLVGGMSASALVALAPVASASAPSLCGEMGGAWNGQYCHVTVVTDRKAVREIDMALPGDLVDNPVIHNYLATLMNNWKTAGAKMAANSFAGENFEIFSHGSALSVVFHEDYSAEGNVPHVVSNAYRTFTFDNGRQLQLSDLMRPGADAFASIPVLGEPFIQDALNAAPPPHSPGTYPFLLERFTPDKVYSGGYKAWALTPDELILYMPDYPVGVDTNIDYTPGARQWGMDGGTVQAHIPLSALASILRPGYGGA